MPTFKHWNIFGAMKKLKTGWFILRFFFWFGLIKLLTLYFRIIPKKNPRKDVLYLESLPSDGAGYNYRARKWIELLNKKGWSVESRFIIENAKDFFERTTTDNLQDFLIHSIRKQLSNVLYARNFKVVIVRRNLLIYNQYGNLFMEKFLHAAVINSLLDFDDDLGYLMEDSKQSLFNKLLMRNQDHFYKSFCYYNGFITGTEYLKDLVIQKKPSIQVENIAVIPTCVDYTERTPKSYDGCESRPLVFGWIGGNHNLILLERIIPFLNDLSKEHDFSMLVIAGVNHYDFKANFPVKFEQYSLETEIEHLLKMDIGLMPLIDDQVSKGKCGFKLLQYMGLGIPSIGSAITVNTEIIDHERNGWLVYNEQDWSNTLQDALTQTSKLAAMGIEARKKVDHHYSFQSNFPSYKSFIEQFLKLT